MANCHPYIRKLTGRGRSILSRQGNAGTATYEPGGSFGPIRQWGYQMVLLQEGSADLRIGNDLIHMEPEDIVLMRPGPLVEIRFSPDQLSAHSWATLQSEKIDPDLRDALDRCAIQAKSSSRMQSLIAMITDLDSVAEENFRVGYLAHMTQCIFCEYIHLSGSVNSGSERAYLNRALAWVQRHYADHVTVDDFASGVGVSRQYLAKLFRANSMGTPAQYLWGYRIEKARILLTETELSLQEIADRTGFQNAFHFSRKFKSIYGCAPSTMRA